MDAMTTGQGRPRRCCDCGCPIDPGEAWLIWPRLPHLVLCAVCAESHMRTVTLAWQRVRWVLDRYD